MQDALGYEGRRAVVTGAASGMGAATAQLLVELGADVVALDLRPTRGFAANLEVDLRDQDSIEAAVAAIDGPIDAVCSCAGLPGEPFSDLDVMLVNVVGARHLIELLVPKMSPGGAITTIASAAGIGWQDRMDLWTGLVSSDGFAAGKAWCEANPEAIASGYFPSKQAMNAWVAWRSYTLIAEGIRLNCLNPGPTDTPMMPSFEDQVGAELIDEFAKPIGRRSTAEEQAWPMVVLNSPRLSYVTGAAFYADGGFFAGVQAGQSGDGVGYA